MERLAQEEDRSFRRGPHHELRPVYQTEYIPFIDGLRAIAVLAVVAFHVGLPGFTGGFVGVDIFFVISGFLITSLLMRELEASGRIDLLRFFAHRVRRLWPALFLVLAATLVTGAVLLVPIEYEQQNLAQSAKRTLLFVSNHYFAKNAGNYFDGPSELLPLLHTWSLSVEEQFYIAWPVLLILLGLLAVRVGVGPRLLAAAALVVVVGLSLYVSTAGVGAGGRNARDAFYLLPSRAWELAIGSLLALVAPLLTIRSPGLGDTLVAAGLAATVLCIIGYDHHTPFPGLSALVPVLATATIILGGLISPGGAATRVLGWRPLVLVGLVSYPWYLWHWPLLAIARSGTLGEQMLLRDAALALIALLLAWATYRFVERPVRGRWIWADWSNIRTVAVAASSSLVLFGGAESMRLLADQSLRDPNSHFGRLEIASKDRNPILRTCNLEVTANGLPARDSCTRPAGSRPRVLLWGDSHADHLMPMLAKAGVDAGIGVLQRSMSGCPPVLGVQQWHQTAPRPDCRTFNDLVAAEIDDLVAQGLTGVVLAARWPIYVHETTFNGRIMSLAFGAERAPSGSPASRAAFADGLAATLRRLQSKKLRVILMASSAEHHHRVPLCLAHRAATECATPRAPIDNYTRPADAYLSAAVSNRDFVRLFELMPLLCDLDYCPVTRGGTALYIDTDHLTASAAQALAPAFADPLQWLLQFP